MAYTVLAASYANEDHSAVIVMTAEVGPKAVSEADMPELWADLHATGVAIEPYVPTPPPPYVLTKLQITGAMSDAQLEEFYTLMAEQPLRMRRAWEDCQEVSSSHVFFAALHSEMAQKWGGAEADRILGPR